MTQVLLIVGAMIGAPARYLADRAVARRHDSVFPWGTLVVNVVGSLGLGFLAVGVTAHAVPEAMSMALGVGLCGTLTTFSTFSYETLRLLQAGSRFYAGMNAVANIGAGIGAATVGAMVALSIWQ